MHQKKSVFKKLFLEGKINNIFDVGANEGQFGLEMIQAGYKGRMHSFEPVTSAFLKLEEISKNFQGWAVYNFALGTSNERAKIHVSKNCGASSSFLQINEFTAQNFPNSVTIAIENVRIKNARKILSSPELLQGRILLKLDTQGYEFRILNSLEKNLQKINYCLIEVSTIPLYEGEENFLKVLQLLEENNHEDIEIFQSAYSQTGDLLQMDVLTRLKTPTSL